MNKVNHSFDNHKALIILSLSCLFISDVIAKEAKIYECSTSKCIHQTLNVIQDGDSLILEGGKVYETRKSFKLEANGTKNKRITFTSQDNTGQNRQAIISTVNGMKEKNLVAMKVTGSYWNISNIEVTGKRVPLQQGYWDVNGFRIGLYLDGARYNNIRDVHIHHTHNAAVAIRNESHHNKFKKMHIHHIGEWLGKDFNAHEGEGFYIGSSKGRDKAGNKARVHDILIEDSIIGPSVLGQYVDIKYGASEVIVRQNTFNVWEQGYNEEIIKLAGFANRIENNKFIGSYPRLKQYIHLLNKKTKQPILIDYRGQKQIPSPTGRDNTIISNKFYGNRANILMLKNDLKATDLSTLTNKGNVILPLKALKH